MTKMTRSIQRLLIDKLADRVYSHRFSDSIVSAIIPAQNKT